MTGCGDGFGVSGNLCLTYSTVNYGIVTAVNGTSSVSSVLLYGSGIGMTECGNDFGISGKLCLTYSTVNYGIVASVCGTSSISSILLYRSAIGVTCSGESYSIFGNLCLTYSTVNYDVVASVNGTSSVSSVLLYGSAIGVTGSGDGFGVSGNLCLTYSTVNYGVVASVNGTSSVSSVFLYRSAIGVTGSIDICLRNKRFATYITYYAIGKTGSGTSGSVARNSLFSMSVSGNYTGKRKEIITDLTNHEVGHTFLGTSGSIALNKLFFMSKSHSFITYIAVITRRAGIGGISIGSTGRLGNLRSIAVTGSVNSNGYSGDLFATSDTVNYSVVASVCGTGRIYGTVYNRRVRIVTERINEIVIVNVITLGAGVGCISILSTGGSGYNAEITMTERIALGKSTDLTRCGIYASGIKPLVLTNFRAYGNGNIGGNVINLEGVGFIAVGNSCRNDSSALTDSKGVLYAYHKIEHSVIAVMNDK